MPFEYWTLISIRLRLISKIPVFTVDRQQASIIIRKKEAIDYFYWSKLYVIHPYLLSNRIMYKNPFLCTCLSTDKSIPIYKFPNNILQQWRSIYNLLFLFVQLFKMEDVSVGLWVQQFNRTIPVEYIHSAKFCPYGCIDDYYTAHYQSPRLMLCMWEKLLEGRPGCCSVR